MPGHAPCFPIPRGFTAIAALLLPVVACDIGCVAKKPAPMAAPRAEVSLTHYAGTPLTGPVAIGASPAPQQPAVQVEVRWLALQQAPAGQGAEGLVPVGADARLVLDALDRRPVRATNRLTAGAQWAVGDRAAALTTALTQGKFGQAAEVAKLKTALPPGVTADVEAADAAVADAAVAGADGRRVELFVHHPAAAPGTIELALSVQDFVSATADEPAMNDPAATESDPSKIPSRRGGKKAAAPAPPATQPAAPPVLSRELAVLKSVDVRGGGMTAVIVLPFRFHNSPAQSLAAVIRAAPAGNDAATVQALARALADVRREADAAARRPAVAPAGPAEWPGYQAALDALGNPSTRRRALVYLAGQTGARLTAEVALSADEPTLQQLATAVQANAVTARPPYTGAALGWNIEATSLSMLARLSGENRLPPELAAVLSTYAGEAGRRPASLEELARAASSPASLEARLVSENLIYLDDSSPAARVRAHDWLAARGRAPAGYDPLGPPRQRRQALDRAIEAAATQPAAPAPAAAASAAAASAGPVRETPAR